MERGTLILEDGTEFKGFVFGAATNKTGEVGERKRKSELKLCYRTMC